MEEPQYTITNILVKQPPKSFINTMNMYVSAIRNELLSMYKTFHSFKVGVILRFYSTVTKTVTHVSSDKISVMYMLCTHAHKKEKDP